MPPPLPAPRGPLSNALLDVLTSAAPAPPGLLRLARDGVAGGDVLADEDVQLSLYLGYQLHYRGLAGVDDGWEWDPDLLRLRAVLETAFERDLRALVPAVDAGAVPTALRALAAADTGPSLSAYLARQADGGQWAEFLMLRSVYHLIEADPHTWVLPRLGGRAKAAVVEIQSDEYGNGRLSRMHAELFARVLRSRDLDDRVGGYVDRAPASQLATVNAMSLFGLHRRLRGAAVGHLAAIEMTSTEPNRRYGAGLRRLRADEDALLFYDEHVEADAVHEQIAAVDLAGGLVQDEPQLAGDVLWGAGVALALEERAGTAMLAAWAAGRSALRPQVRSLAAA